MPRKYTKRSEYWEKFRKTESPIEDLLKQQEQEFVPELIGDPVFSSSASRLDSPTSRTKARTNSVAVNGLGNKFLNIKMVFYPLIMKKMRQMLGRLLSFVKKRISTFPLSEAQ